MYYELTPAYGRDYKSKKEVIAAWNEGKDFEGDYNLGFKPVNKPQIPLGSTVLLRYKGNTRVANVKVTSQELTQSKPKTMQLPSMEQLSEWSFDGIAQATDGCEVEPDGHCEHGKPSWLLKLGYI